MGLVRYMVKEMIREIENKSQEFYEFVLPPIDMHLDEEKLTLVADMPGFEKKNISLVLNRSILSIQAHKEMNDKEKSDGNNMICSQRPNIIDKKIRLPIKIRDREGEKSEISAKYDQGVLTVTIPVQKHGKNITIE